MKEALLIIDVQNDYFPGGANPQHRALEAEAVIRKWIIDSRIVGRPIIYMQHFNGPEDSFFRPGTNGAEISPRIAPMPQDKIIVKYAPNSFLNTELDAYLKSLGVVKLIVCGMMTHMCVDTTVRSAMDHGYSVDLIADGCATRDLTIGDITIPAETVQMTYLASLSGTFANLI